MAQQSRRIPLIFPPESPGKQALSVTAAGSGQAATVDSYFDTTNTRNFVLLNGTYQIAFRAKGVGGNNQMTVSLGRQISQRHLFHPDDRANIELAGL